MRLTDTVIKNLRAPPTGQKSYPDDTLPGFCVRVSQGGTKTFSLVYGATRERTTIGRYPLIGLAEARTVAKERLAEQTLGRHRPARMVFEDAIPLFVAEKEKKNRARTINGNERILRKYAARLHRKNLSDISAPDITKILDNLTDTPGTALHVFWTLRTFLRWCFKRGYIDRNPIERLDPPSKTVFREHVLTDDELRTVWQAAEEQSGPLGGIVRLLILTGQRRGEIGALRASWCSLPSSKDGEIRLIPAPLAVGGEDTDCELIPRPSMPARHVASDAVTIGPRIQSTICLPKEITKNKRQHTFPISALAAAILSSNITQGTINIFPAKGKADQPFNGWSKAKVQLDQKINEDREKAGLLPIAPWTLHDLRRTFATALQRLDVRIEVIEALLNHISGSRAGIVGVYQRHKYEALSRRTVGGDDTLGTATTALTRFQGRQPAGHKNRRTIGGFFSCENDEGQFFRFLAGDCLRDKLLPHDDSRPVAGHTMILGTDCISTNDPVRLSTDALRRHLYIVGKSGTGKSVLLDNLISDLIENGSGCCLIDPHGDLAEAVASRIPQKRMNDVIYFDPADLSFSIGYNPLNHTIADNRPLVAENVLSAFAHVWGLSAQHTPRLLHILRNALRLLLDNQETLLGLPILLTNARYRERLLKRCEDATVKMFWDDEFGRWNDRQRSEYIASLQNKAGAFMGNPAMRNTLSHSTFDVEAAMNGGRVLVCNLSKGRLGEETSNLLGALLATGFAQSAHGRATIPEDKRRDFTLIIDEFQNFTTSAFADILSEARKYRLSLVVAHQFLSQVPQALQDAVIGTANTIVVFRCGATDAPLLASELDLDQPRELKNLANYRAIVRTLHDGFPGDVRRIQTVPPRPIGKRLKAVKSRTRARYARPRTVVEKKVTQLLTT